MRGLARGVMRGAKTPREIGFYPGLLTNLGLWLDANDASTITLNSGKVSQWDDKSGNGNNHVQPTANRQPVYDTTGIGGLSSIDFDHAIDDETLKDNTTTGITDVEFFSFVFQPTSAITNASARTAPIAFQNDVNNKQVEFGSSTGAFSDEIVILRSDDGVSSGANGWTHASDTITAAPHILTFDWDGTNWQIYLDGVSKKNANDGTPTKMPWTVNVVGANTDTGNLNYLGQIGEVVVAGATTAAERLRLESYFTAKWGV